MLSDLDLDTLESLHAQGTSLRACLQLAYCHGRVDELRASVADIKSQCVTVPDQMTALVDDVLAKVKCDA